jgi:ATP diphosphatase
MNRDLLALPGPQQRQRDRRSDADLARAHIGLIHADNCHGDLFITLVRVDHRRAEKNLVPLRLRRRIDNFGMSDAIDQKSEPPVDLAQTPLALLVVGVLAAIAVARRPGHDFDHPVACGALFGQFGLEPFMTGRRHVELAAGQPGRAIVIVVFHRRVFHRRVDTSFPNACKRLAPEVWLPYPRCMSDPAASAEAELRRLLDIMAALRDPVTGCPWDKMQTFETIAPYTVEEAYEVADAIAQRDFAALPDELGDLLFQVVYHARMAEEAGQFAFADIAKCISDKMIRRHPHVFGDAAARDAVAQTAAWEAQKSAERAARRQSGALAGVPAALPALTRALKLTNRAARVGFDWPDADQVLAKLEEEIQELRAELSAGDPARLTDEVGDLLFVLANLARKLKLDPETCLRHANEKFSRRFNAMERDFESQAKTLSELSLDEMEAGWQRVKAAEHG